MGPISILLPRLFHSTAPLLNFVAPLIFFLVIIPIVVPKAVLYMVGSSKMVWEHIKKGRSINKIFCLRGEL